MAEITVPASLQRSLDETKVEYVNLGSSGLRVSVPVLGSMSVGSKQWAPWVLDGDDALEILKAAFDRGINTWDTANMYSNGISEEIIGEAIRRFNIPRRKLVLMTKCSVYVAEEPGMHAAPF
jgi:aryl-alcohol dehydrogenase-like predicted oxidoreductase